MEVLRFARALLPLAAIALLGPTGVARPPVARDGGPTVGSTGVSGGRSPRGHRPAASPGSGWTRCSTPRARSTGQRLTLGRGRRDATRQLALPPESFASGPVGGIVLVGDDDGTRSRLRAVDPAAAARRRSPWRRRSSAAPILDHGPRRDVRAPRRPARRARTSASGGVRPAAGRPCRLLPGLAPDARHGRTFSTDLRWASDGRLAVASCGELACRTRIVDTATGTRGRDERHRTGRRRHGVARDRLRRLPRASRAACRRRPGDDRCHRADRRGRRARVRRRPTLVFEHDGHLGVARHADAASRRDVAASDGLRAGRRRVVGARRRRPATWHPCSLESIGAAARPVHRPPPRPRRSRHRDPRGAAMIRAITPVRGGSARWPWRSSPSVLVAGPGRRPRPGPDPAGRAVRPEPGPDVRLGRRRRRRRRT